MVCREEEGRRRVKSLQRQLTEVKREKEEEVQQRNEMIAHLKVIHSFHYRPKTKLRKVMFSHLSVSHSVHGGGRVSEHAMGRELCIIACN